MTDFGGKLRQAREGRGVSLRQIAATTKISVTYLEALERNDLSRLPGGIFSRAFVRSYAQEVGLDPDQTVREFIERFQQEPAEVSVSAQTVASLLDEDGDFERRQRMAKMLLKIIVASFLVAAVIFYLTWRQSSAERQSSPATGERTPTRGASFDHPWIPASVRL
jgi:cytoskeletal protein RodZ